MMSQIQHKKFLRFHCLAILQMEPNQLISSIKSEHLTKTKIYQPIENENVNSI